MTTFVGGWHANKKSTATSRSGRDLTAGVMTPVQIRVQI
jgi:hypothetical protein